jgi:hypothetical protein
MKRRQHCCYPRVRETSRIISLHVTSPWHMKLTLLFWRDNNINYRSNETHDILCTYAIIPKLRLSTESFTAASASSSKRLVHFGVHVVTDFNYWWRNDKMFLKFHLFNNIGLIDWLLFYIPLKNFSLIWRRHHYRRRAAKFRPMLGAQGLWAGRDLYRATPAVTWGLGFSGHIWRTTHSIAFYDTLGDVEDVF